ARRAPRGSWRAAVGPRAVRRSASPRADESRGRASCLARSVAAAARRTRRPGGRALGRAMRNRRPARRARTALWRTVGRRRSLHSPALDRTDEFTHEPLLVLAGQALAKRADHPLDDLVRHLLA